MVKLPFESMTTEFQSSTSNHDDGLYLYADQAGCLINPCLFGGRKTMGSRKDCPLDEPPKVAWKWGSWDGRSLFHQWEQPHLCFTQAFQVPSAGASRLFCNSPKQLAPQSYWFSKLGRLLPWNPVKRTAAAKGSVSWSSAGDVSSCASFWHICGILRECGTISTILRLSSCLRAPAYTVWLQISCAVFVYPPGLPRPDERSKHPSGLRQRNKSHKTDNSEGCWSCFPFCNFPCMKAFSVCSLIHLSPIILKVTNVYWTLWPCAMLWANCLVMASLILHNRALM